MKNKSLIFVVVDSLRKDFLLKYGKIGFAKFREKGIFLDKLFTHAPETYLSIGTFFTGIYPAKHKSGHISWQAQENISHLLDYLKNDGYAMLLHGRFAPFGVSYGTGYYIDNYGKLPDKICNETMGLNPNIDETLNFIESHKNEKFFIYNHFFTLRNLEENMKERIDHCCEKGDIDKVINSYIECLAQVDLQIDRLFECVKDKLDETLVVITADHGESFSLYDNHILGDTGAAWNLHNGSRYDEAINIPMIFAGACLPNNKIISEQIRQIDIFPTIASLIGLEISKDAIDGECLDLYNAINAKDIIVYSTSETKKQAIRSKDNYKLIFDSKNIELFNLNEDPKEQRNIASMNKEKVREVFELLSQFPTQEIITSKDLIFRYTDYKNIEYVSELFKQLGLFDEWTKRAKTYNNISWVTDNTYLEKIYELIKPQKHDIVLEVGCGTAIISNFLNNSVAKVYGIDPSPAMLQLANKDIDTRIGTADNIPFQDSYFDKIIVRMLLHHLDPTLLDKSMQEIRRVLKKNGFVLFAEGVPIKDELMDSFKTFLQEKEDRIFFSGSDILALVSKFFSVVKYEDIILKQQSVMNWLENSATDEIRKTKIYRMHRDESQEIYKKIANFTRTEDDVLIDMRHFIIIAKKIDEKL